MNRSTSIVLADDHALVRQALRERFEREPDMVVLADVGCASAATDIVKAQRPDIVILDIDMPGVISFEAAKIMQTISPHTRVLFLSAFFSNRYIEQALAVEASGYVTKGESIDTVVQAIRTIASGATYYSPDVQRRLVVDETGVRLAEPMPQTPLSALTHREREVLRYIARGLPKKKIAALLHVTVSAIDAHSNRLMNKLGIHDRVRLALLAIREGLAEA